MTIRNHWISLAEDEGFKPPIPKKGIPDFESSAFGHSANFPHLQCKGNQSFPNYKIITLKFYVFFFSC